MVSRIIIVFALAVAVVNAATFIGLLPPIPEHLAHKKGCYIKEVDDVINFGEEIVPIGNCVSITCSPRTIGYATCGSVGTDDPKCRITDTDDTKPYPLCCPTVVCDTDNYIA